MSKITLSGLAGSGKSTIGKMLAKQLDYSFISIGDFSRKYAMEKYGADINRFQQICIDNPEIDLELDKEFERFGKTANNFVIDYRLGTLFIPDGFHIYLQVSDKVAASRIKMTDRGNEFGSDELIQKLSTLNARNLLMRQRFIDRYQFDFTDSNNYHLNINTNCLSPEQIVEIVTNNLMKG